MVCYSSSSKIELEHLQIVKRIRIELIIDVLDTIWTLALQCTKETYLFLFSFLTFQFHPFDNRNVSNLFSARGLSNNKLKKKHALWSMLQANYSKFCFVVLMYVCLKCHLKVKSWSTQNILFNVHYFAL